MQSRILRTSSPFTWTSFHAFILRQYVDRVAIPCPSRPTWIWPGNWLFSLTNISHGLGLVDTSNHLINGLVLGWVHTCYSTGRSNPTWPNSLHSNPMNSRWTHLLIQGVGSLWKEKWTVQWKWRDHWKKILSSAVLPLMKHEHAICYYFMYSLF